MIREVWFDRFAIEELRSARLYYELRSPKAAAGFEVEFEATLKLLGENAELGAVFRKKFRWMKLERYPYILFYEIEDDIVWVDAFAHEARQPGYWIRRT